MNPAEFSIYDFEGMTASELAALFGSFPPDAKVEVKTETFRSRLIGGGPPEEKEFLVVTW